MDGAMDEASDAAGMVLKKSNIVVRLVRHEGPYAALMAASWLFGALSGLVSIGMYVYLYLVADTVIAWGQDAAPDALARLGWQALFCAGMAFSTYGIALLFSHLTAFNTIARIRIGLVRHLERVPLGYFSVNASGEVRKTVEKSVESVEGFIAHKMPDLAQSIVMPIAFTASMFFFDWRLALACMVPVAVGFATLGLMLKSESASLIERYQEALGAMSSAGVEYVRGMGVVKIFGQTVRSFRSLFDSIVRYKRFSLDYIMSMEGPMAVYRVASNGAFLVLIPTAILLYGFSNDQAAVLRSFVFFIVFTPLTSLVMARVMDCSSHVMMATQSLDVIDGVLDVRAQKRVSLQAGASAPPLPERFDIAFREVRFRYADDAPWALDGLTFTARARAVTALVGASGSGKSTAASLVARLWDVGEGSVAVGGFPVGELPFDWWMRRCACVFQDVGLLKMSVADNVAFCCEGATEAEVAAALHEACCDDILEKLPDGVRTIVGADGIYLSGGERQRIALARAILQDAPVIVLDEATSFADPENEHLILQALETLVRGKTVIMIAHRLSTVTGADHIVVIDKGRVAEQGDHDALIERDGIYARMFEEYRQSTAWQVAAGRGARKGGVR